MPLTTADCLAISGLVALRGHLFEGANTIGATIRSLGQFWARGPPAINGMAGGLGTSTVAPRSTVGGQLWAHESRRGSGKPRVRYPDARFARDEDSTGVATSW